MKIIFQIIFACLSTIIWLIVYILSSILIFLWTFNKNSFKIGKYEMNSRDNFWAVDLLWSEIYDDPGNYRYRVYKSYFHYIWNLSSKLTLKTIINKFYN